jgi:hypothetical protein
MLDHLSRVAICSLHVQSVILGVFGRVGSILLLLEGLCILLNSRLKVFLFVCITEGP